MVKTPVFFLLGKRLSERWVEMPDKVRPFIMY
jgi:hypothetical protein